MMKRRDFIKSLSGLIAGGVLIPPRIFANILLTDPSAAAAFDEGDILLQSYFKQLSPTQKTSLGKISTLPMEMHPEIPAAASAAPSTGLRKDGSPIYRPEPQISTAQKSPRQSAASGSAPLPRKSAAKKAAGPVKPHKAKPPIRLASLSDREGLKGNGPPDNDFVRSYQYKMRQFNRPHAGDIFLNRRDMRTLKSCLQRLGRLRSQIGHRNFYLTSFDQSLKLARSYTSIGPFNAAEVAFLEKIFYQDASAYGFFGKKPITVLTHSIRKGEVTTIPRTGNYLYRGTPVATYQRIRKDIGSKAVLTSGVRSVMKQMHLFLGKVYKNRGNLSLASRSLAPPGFSYHGVSDFDIGQKGYGADNFTDRFAQTDVFKRLRSLDYVKLRYLEGNLLGVRYEPWHVKVGA